MPRYIDAEALNAYIESAECNSVGKALQAIDNAPTVSPDEVRGVGKWIHFTRKYISGVDDEGAPMIRCSVCDYTQFESSRSSTNYCPSCGARMKGAEDGTTDNPKL